MVSKVTQADNLSVLQQPWFRQAEQLALIARALEAQQQRCSALEQALVEANRAAILSSVAGTIAHDFNNTLFSVSGSLHMIKSLAQEPTVQQFAGIALLATERSTRLIRHLMLFSRPHAIGVEILASGPILHGCSELLALLVGSPVVVCVESTSRWHMCVDRHQLEIALIHLSLNAKDAMPEGGQLTIGARDLPADAAVDGTGIDMIEIYVRDSGAGMTAGVQALLDTQFFTTKTAEPGAGLRLGMGLAAVRNFVKQAGGTFALESIVGHGTTAMIRLPRAADAPSAVRV